jgi:hypothetical protein
VLRGKGGRRRAIGSILAADLGLRSDLLSTVAVRAVE